jgi:hypothetical protein
MKLSTILYKLKKDSTVQSQPFLSSMPAKLIKLGFYNRLFPCGDLAEALSRLLEIELF